MEKLINLLKQAFEGPDGKISSKKITLFLFSSVFIFLNVIYGYSLVKCKEISDEFVDIYKVITTSILIQIGVNVAYNGIVSKILSGKIDNGKTKTK